MLYDFVVRSFHLLITRDMRLLAVVIAYTGEWSFVILNSMDSIIFYFCLEYKTGSTVNRSESLFFDDLQYLFLIFVVNIYVIA